MSFRVFRDQLSMDTVAAGFDEVIGWAQIPSEGKMNGVNADIHMILGGFLGTENAMVYGCKGLVARDFDPDSNKNANNVWDIVVPKDIDMASGVIDSDYVTTAVTAPFFEPGEPNVNELYGFDEHNEFYKRVKMITVASAPRMSDPTTSPGDWLPTDTFKIDVHKRIDVDFDSWAMIAIASPSMDDVTLTMQVWGGNDFPVLKYLKKVLEDSFWHAVGLTTTEQPFDDAALLLERFVVPTVYEDVAGAFATQTWTVFGNFTWDISVPGELALGGQVSG